MSYILVHTGIKDMRWGVRRFQNPDGSLTEAGKARYAKATKYQAKADKYKARVPSFYLTDWGKFRAERNTQKAAHAEGKAKKLMKVFDQEKLNAYASSIKNHESTNAGRAYCESLLKKS